MCRTPPIRSRCARLAFAACALLCLAPRAASALDPNKAVTQYIQSAWTSESGLPQDSVHAITQTRDGFLWLGTEEGLARFDGRQFRVYDRRTSKDLASDYIDVLCPSRDGSLWIGTDSGLTHFLPESLAATSSRNGGVFSTLTVKDGLASDDIRSLYETEDGTLWVGTSDGLNRLRRGSVETWNTKRGLAGNEVDAIAVDSRGAVWVATDGGVSRLNNGHVTTWTTAQGLPGNRAVALSIEPDDSVLVSILGHGLTQIHAGHPSPAAMKLPWPEINALLRDRDGALWMAFDRHGMGRLYNGKLSLFNNGDGLPSDRSTRALFEDREGNLWAGMLDAGVVELRSGKFTVYGKPEGLPGNYIGNLLQARDGSMWFGSDSNGLTHLLPDGRIEQWNHRRGLPDEAVFSLLQANDGSLWVGYRRGALAHIVNQTVTIYRDPVAPESSLNALLEDRDGTLWIGYFGKGLATFSNGHFQHFSATQKIPGLAQAADGALWLATDGDGVERIFHGAVTRFTAANGLPTDHAMCISADPNGDVWVGTASGGLSRIRGGQVVSWTQEQGLNNSTVGSVVIDQQGDIWIGGDSGIERIARRELDEWQAGRDHMLHPLVFGTADGLRSRETVYGSMPSASRDAEGRLWFATIMGAAMIDPAHIPMNDVIPPVWIDRAIVNSQSVVPQNGNQFSLGSGNIEFLFTAPTFVAPQNESFRYRLIGFDRDWIAAGNRRQAWYTNLPAGHYTFAVQAQNSDGKWNTTGASFTFIFLPPLARTPLAYGFYAIVVLVLAWFGIRFRTGTLIRRQQELKRIVTERTEQLEAEKQALSAARKELQSRATYDSLTGLLNRGSILERLEHEVSRSIRDNTPIGVIIADLDFFKKINDTYGHLCGDEVIRETAERLRAALRSYDLAGRYGGEEFLIVLPGWDAAIAPDRVNELLEAIRSRPYQIAGNELRITCSIGAATFRPSKGDADILEMLRKSDAELYVAKQNGRDQASIASPTHVSLI